VSSRRHLGWIASLGLVGCGGGVASSRPPSYQADTHQLRLQPLTIFQSSVGPVSQQTGALRDVHGAIPERRVTAEECQYGLQLPLLSLITGGKVSLSLSAGWGQGGYDKALAKAQREAGPETYLVDVRADLRSISVLLGIWQQQCVIVDAGVVPPSALTEPPTPSPSPSPAPAPPPVIDADGGAPPTEI
jgi:hypothetical protein